MRSRYDDSEDAVCVGRCEIEIVECDLCNEREDEKKALFILTADGMDLCPSCYDDERKATDPQKNAALMADPS